MPGPRVSRACQEGEASMRIGFDVSQTGGNKAGCGFFADGLIRALAALPNPNQYVLYPTFGNFFWSTEGPDATFSCVESNFCRGLCHDTFPEMQAFWSCPPGNHEELLGNPDILHANNFFCPQTLRNARLVYTLYDLNFLLYPEFTTETNRTGCFQGIFNANIFADGIIAISEATKDHFLKTFPAYPRERIWVVHPSSRFDAVTMPRAPQNPALEALSPGQFWLNVGTIEPRKNQKLLLRVLQSIKKSRGRTMPMVFAGGAGWLMEDFTKVIKELDLEDNVVLPGYVSDTDLAWLYGHCFAMVYPSLFEGFGMPVLEAMGYGAPVITSNVSSLPEITGKDGLLVAADDGAGLEAAMMQLVDDPRRRDDLAERGRQRARQFSWKLSAERLLQAYDAVMALPKRAL